MNTPSINALKLGNTTFADLSVEKDSLYLIRNVNQVYVNTNDAEYTDLLQLEYRPYEHKVKLGRAKFYDVESREIKHVDIYVPTILYPFCDGGVAPSKEHVFDNDFTFETDFEIDGFVNTHAFNNNWTIDKTFDIEGYENELAFNNKWTFDKTFEIEGYENELAFGDAFAFSAKINEKNTSYTSLANSLQIS